MQADSARQTAIRFARAKLALKPIYVDTETTGLGRDAEIVEVCVLDHDGSVLISTLVKPKSEIPWFVTRIHGITNQMVAKCPIWRDVWPDVTAALAGRQVAMYNASFDERMMRQSHTVHRMRWELPGTVFFCVMQTYARFCGGYRIQKLSEAGRQCKLKLPHAHRAQADAELTRGVLQYVGNCRR